MASGRKTTTAKRTIKIVKKNKARIVKVKAQARKLEKEGYIVSNSGLDSLLNA